MHIKETMQNPDSSSFPIAGEDLYKMAHTGRMELVEGELVRMAPTGYVHGLTESRFAKILRNFAEERGLGEVLVGEVGIYTRRNPDTVRGADVVYISRDQLSKAKTDGFLDVAPELVVEILSPGDRWSDVHDKLEEYFGIGVQAVWIADPKHKRLFAYSSPTHAKSFAENDIITDENILPGFEMLVAEFFYNRVPCNG
jgi:Uma2 family endonuclease